MTWNGRIACRNPLTRNGRLYMARRRLDRGPLNVVMTRRGRTARRTHSRGTVVHGATAAGSSRRRRRWSGASSRSASRRSTSTSGASPRRRSTRARAPARARRSCRRSVGAIDRSIDRSIDREKRKHRSAGDVNARRSQQRSSDRSSEDSRQLVKSTHLCCRAISPLERGQCGSPVRTARLSTTKRLEPTRVREACPVKRERERDLARL